MVESDGDREDDRRIFDIKQKIVLQYPGTHLVETF